MKPPRVAVWVLAAVCPEHMRDDLLGDLQEEYSRFKVPELGRLRAGVWYWRQVVGSFVEFRSRRAGRGNGDEARAPYGPRHRRPGSSIAEDARHTLRALRRSPGLSVAAVTTLALGIGAISATYGFAGSLLLYTPPVSEPERLVRLFIGRVGEAGLGGWSYPDFVDFHERNAAFSGLIAEGVRPLHLSHEGDSTRIWGSIVSGNYFSELGVEPALGRGFLPQEDETRGTHAVVVLGHALWRDRFGADEGIVGERVILNGHAFTVIGVGPEGFVGTNVGVTPSLWVPFMMADVLVPAQNILDARAFQGIPFVIGRLKAEATIELARQSSSALMEQLARENPAADAGKRVRVYSEGEAGLHPLVRRPLVAFIGMMSGFVAIILLLTCANVAGLFLARSLIRSREVAIRLALGASRLRIVRQLMTESVVIAVLAAGLGLLLARWLIQLVKALLPSSDLPVDWTIPIDARVLGFTLLVALATAVLFGLAPAVDAARREVMIALKASSASPGGRTGKVRQALVVFQVALTLALLIGATMTASALRNVMEADLGFEPEGVFVTSVDLELQGYEPVDARQLQRALKRRVESLPGVEAVAFAQRVPLNLGVGKQGIIPEGYQWTGAGVRPLVDYNVVDADYFEALRISLLRGRGFGAADDDNAPRVLVINEAFAERFWPGQEPLGKTVSMVGGEHRVIGVVNDGKYLTIREEPLPYFFLSLNQTPRGAANLHVRSSLPLAALAGPVREAVTELDEKLPVADLQTMHSALGFALLPTRVAATVVVGFAAVALLLASIGLYGVISASVNGGLHDIGVRMALGATAGNVVSFVLREGVVLTAVGLAVGLLGGHALARLIAGLLYGVSATDLLPYLAAATLLGAVALLASYLPACRAARADLLAVLKTD